MRLGVFIGVITLFCTLPGFTKAADARDFTGLWQAFASESDSSRRSDQRLSAEGEIKVADFAVLYPNLIDPASYCLSSGMLAMMTTIARYPIEIMHTPGRMTMFAPMNNQYRRIFIDARDIPESTTTSRMGYSVGSWNGDTLVVETRQLSDMLMGQFPSTESTIVTERISLTTRDQVSATADDAAGTPIDDAVLVFNITISDPTLYDKPQTLSVYYQQLGDDALMEDDCTADLWQQALDAANR